MSAASVNSRPMLPRTEKQSLQESSGAWGFWDVVLISSGLCYVVLALCLELESPSFVLGFILSAAYTIIAPHCKRRRD